MPSTNTKLKMNSFGEEAEEYYAKCGEMFFTVNGNIAFHCTLCEEKFKNFQVYNDHILDIHLAPDLRAELLADFVYEEEDTFDFLSEEACSKEEHSIKTNENDEDSMEIFEQIKETSKEGIKNVNLSESDPTEDCNTIELNEEGIRLSIRSINRKPTLEGEKYKCPYCEYTCTVKPNIRKHIKRHSLNRPHKCKECGKAFYTRTELIVHIRWHTGERPYLCNLCARSFVTAGKLREHQKRHSDMRDKVCDLCKASFITGHDLAVHMAVHTTIRDYKCTLCHSTFKLPQILERHMKLHENKRSYQCKLCEAKFNQNGGLHSHMKYIHSVPKSTKKS